MLVARSVGESWCAAQRPPRVTTTMAPAQCPLPKRVVASGASRRGWIPPHRAMRTGVCAAIGFLAAALIATQTLGSPIGPILSTSLIGFGALVGAGRADRDGIA